MKIVGAAFGRTGTKSLKFALERLGFGPCHHMFELRENPSQLPYWQAAARGEAMDWSEVFQGYRSSVDWPSARYWCEIAAHFPDAKVLLTLRDPDSWFDSIRNTIFPSMRDRARIGPSPRRERLDMAYEVIVRQTFDERMGERDHATGVYRAHIEEVRRTIAPARLLAYEMGSGWEPLCAFLGVPVPDEPFPFENTTAQFVNRHIDRDSG